MTVAVAKQASVLCVLRTNILHVDKSSDPIVQGSAYLGRLGLDIGFVHVIVEGARSENV